MHKINQNQCEDFTSTAFLPWLHPANSIFNILTQFIYNYILNDKYQFCSTNRYHLKVNAVNDQKC